MDVEQYHALPLAGGLWDQPAGLMRKLRQVLNIYHAVKAWKQYGNKPGETAKWKQNNQELWDVVSWVRELRENYG